MASNKKRSGNATTAATNKPAASASPVARTSSTEFKPDYSYVKKDLTRIGILAGSFFVILVVLSFFLR
jgi:hypothetical protein